ncbi:flagellar type III secretion system pore protein FliP [Paraferrimonas sp. SM1919]|uniref:flagellar type III secretion system pore protein FliP n=1 Tax=Paraferrimonas sp. SM1919 TaxID=2662263 RepID=UPI0013D086BE|nr:flagellar type III secretion system pore protein FliP [Paraferrimonas sp. SM1919]
MKKWWWLVLLVLLPALGHADNGFPAVTMTPADDGSEEYSVSLQILLLMTALSFLPALLIMVTSFTRIIVVLAILRQAIGLQQTPSNQILVGIALFLTFFIMSPVIEQTYEQAVKPYIDEQITLQQAYDIGEKPFKDFMLSQTRIKDIDMFASIAGIDSIDSIEQTPMRILIPAFITSELKTAFQIGFMLFLPFLVLDLVVASILMAMGMMMLSPMIVSLPFKIMLFVLVDGWNLVMGTLATSFGVGT